ncbi:hypothetical protein [Hymenobacter psychrophilus]|uniref:Uncharacterized protein n=1 Tax=Hymenobacter psychrophilus TaxID=651662 RepID=A0A1H3PI15_9BACT|nr:hypothetical protein [Hymenobacter psychrophilus]SDZ00711.1 hypothetical protein SAMN04488069_1334 [Hymenobacter psychrophilus]
MLALSCWAFPPLLALVLGPPAILWLLVLVVFFWGRAAYNSRFRR